MNQEKLLVYSTERYLHPEENINDNEDDVALLKKDEPNCRKSN